MTRWLLVALVVASASAGEVLQAYAMRKHGEVRDFRPGAIGRLLALLARNRLIVLSILCLAVSFFAFLSLLSIAELSFAAPATAASYVTQTVLAKFLLKETISPARWAGVTLVACGVALLSF
jgi:drug/metabolite transporter (DMT)-like permease